MAKQEREFSDEDEALMESQGQHEALETAPRYRVARLASAPDVPPEMVPESEDLEEIDLGFVEAQRLVGQLREKLQEEALEAARAFRVPAGSPPRRDGVVSSLSPGEKIK